MPRVTHNFGDGKYYLNQILIHLNNNFDEELDKVDKQLLIEHIEQFDDLFKYNTKLSTFLVACLIYLVSSFTEWKTNLKVKTKKLSFLLEKINKKYSKENKINDNLILMDLCRYQNILDKYFIQKNKEMQQQQRIQRQRIRQQRIQH